MPLVLLGRGVVRSFDALFDIAHRRADNLRQTLDLGLQLRIQVPQELNYLAEAMVRMRNLLFFFLCVAALHIHLCGGLVQQLIGVRSYIVSMVVLTH